MISIIAAVSEDLGIGRSNELLWSISEDLRRFKRLTLGKTVIIGKKTWESLPKKPLPGRKNIVLTDKPGECFDCAETASSVKDSLAQCSNDEEVFIIGGGSIYRQFMPLADRLYITHVHRKTEADTFFPEIDRRVWKILNKEEHKSEVEGVPYTYIIYERRKLKDASRLKIS
jgi:dihydrofolate reductase